MNTTSTTGGHRPLSLPTFAELLLSIGSSRIHPLSLKSDSSPVSGPYDGLNIFRDLHGERMCVRAEVKHHRQEKTIAVLPDNVLLEIFDLCRLNQFMDYGFRSLGSPVWEWHMLVHVCHTWRQVIFASPLRLNLQILCTHGTPVRRRLDIWPTFPIAIRYEYVGIKPTDEDNIVAALEHPSRVCEIRLRVTSSRLGRIAFVMQEPFPALKLLRLSSEDDNIPVLSSGFLGRSTPHLQALRLDGIPFPSLPILLPSASDLVTLSLLNIPHTGYISPEAMVAALVTLTGLETLDLEFRSPKSRPDHIRLPPTPRNLIPALTSFSFHGLREYLEDLAARIDTPLLDKIETRYFNQLIDFEVPQLSRLIDRPENVKRPMSCRIILSYRSVTFRAHTTSYEPESFNFFPLFMQVCIECAGIDWQVSHLAHVVSQISVLPTYTVRLSIEFDFITPNPEDVDDIEWLHLLSQFPSVKALFVSKQFAGHVSSALEAIARVMDTAEVLPALDLLCLEGQPESSVNTFISIRRDSGRPVAFVNTGMEYDGRLQFYD